MAPLGCGPGGRGFKSRRPPLTETPLWRGFRMFEADTTNWRGDNRGTILKTAVYETKIRSTESRWARHAQSLGFFAEGQSRSVKVSESRFCEGFVPLAVPCSGSEAMAAAVPGSNPGAPIGSIYPRGPAKPRTEPSRRVRWAALRGLAGVSQMQTRCQARCRTSGEVIRNRGYQIADGCRCRLDLLTHEGLGPVRPCSPIPLTSEP